jgi:hypothetical protein
MAQRFMSEKVLLASIHRPPTEKVACHSVEARSTVAERLEGFPDLNVTSLDVRLDRVFVASPMLNQKSERSMGNHGQVHTSAK